YPGKTAFRAQKHSAPGFRVRFGAHSEWGRLREAVGGFSPAEGLVVFLEDSARWMSPDLAELSPHHKGRRLIDIDPDWARRCERQVDALAERLGREGVTVH